MSNTYFINVSHLYPIMSLSTNPEYMFDPVIGVYPNYTSDLIEQPIHFEFFENYTMMYEAEAITKVQGSTGASHKSLLMKASEASAFTYPFFPDQPSSTYRSFVLRNGGQDGQLTMFRDEFTSGLMREFDDVDSLIQNPDLDLQDYRPSIVYLNGVYWGIHNLRENRNSSLVKTHYDIDPSDIDMIVNNNIVDDGDLVQWTTFQNFFTNNNFASQFFRM